MNSDRRPPLRSRGRGRGRGVSHRQVIGLVRNHHESPFSTVIRNLPDNPPTIKQDAPITRRFRSVIVDPTASVVIDGAFIVALPGLPSSATSRFIYSLSAWAFPGTTKDQASLTITDTLSSRSFVDSSALGQPYAKAGIIFGLGSRIIDIVSDTPSFASVTAAGSAEKLVIDVVLTYVD